MSWFCSIFAHKREYFNILEWWCFFKLNGEKARKATHFLNVVEKRQMPGWKVRGPESLVYRLTCVDRTTSNTGFSRILRPSVTISIFWSSQLTIQRLSKLTQEFPNISRYPFTKAGHHQRLGTMKQASLPQSLTENQCAFPLHEGWWYHRESNPVKGRRLNLISCSVHLKL